MNRKRNVNYIKPEDPHFLKVLKKEAGYDNSNHKFDKLQISEDFIDEEGELPQVVVLKEGDLTAEEAETEKKRMKEIESESKADLTKKIVFKSKVLNKRKNEKDCSTIKKPKCQDKGKQLLSFADDDDASNSDS